MSNLVDVPVFHSLTLSTEGHLVVWRHDAQAVAVPLPALLEMGVKLMEASPELSYVVLKAAALMVESASRRGLVKVEGAAAPVDTAPLAAAVAPLAAAVQQLPAVLGAELGAAFERGLKAALPTGSTTRVTRGAEGRIEETETTWQR
jgi:hypothetical protein